MNNKVIIYLGPTLKRRVAKKYLNAIYLPPAEQGDILSAIQNYEPKVIGLIDGMFYQARSVWHREILYAMESGIKVFGSSSMGALRAAELCNFGMFGVGKIFQLFYNGTLNDDDEVALLHGDKSLDYQALSIPMVNVRETFQLLKDKDFIKQSEMIDLEKIAKDLHFSERTMVNILRFYKAKKPDFAFEAFNGLFNKHYVDLKKNDAIELLLMIKQYVMANVIEKKTLVNDSAFYNHERFVKNSKGSIRLGEFSNFLTLHLKHYNNINMQAMNKYIVRLYAESLNVNLESYEIEREVRRFRQERGIIDEATFQNWLNTNDLNEFEFDEIIKDIAYSKKMCRWVFYGRKAREKNVKKVLSELKINDTYEPHKSRAIAYINQSKENIRNFSDDYDESNLHNLFSNYICSSGNEIWTSPKLWIEEVGFHDEIEAVHELICYKRNHPNANLFKEKPITTWLKNNLKPEFKDIVVDMLFENFNLHSTKRELVEIIIEKSLRSFIFGVECNFYWITKSLSQYQELKILINQHCKKYNIYDKKIRHHFSIYSRDIDELTKLGSDDESDFFELIIKVDELNHIEKLFDRNQGASKCIKKVWLVFTKEILGDHLQKINILTLQDYEIEITLSDDLLDVLANCREAREINYLKNILIQIFEQWNENRNLLKIKNFEKKLNKILATTSNAKLEVSSSTQFIRITDYGHVLIHTPNPWWMSITDETQITFGNIKEIDSLDEMYLKFKEEFSKFQMSDSICEEQCHYYPLCDRRNYIVNKVKQHGSIANSETINCLVMEKIISDIFIDHLTKISNEITEIV